MTYALDASAIIAHLDPDDAHHAEATGVLLEVPDARLVAHPVTVAESLVVAVRDGRGDEVDARIRELGVDVVAIGRESPMRLATLRVETGLRMPDCCSIDVARHHDAVLVTFDERQATAARGLGLEVRPRPNEVRAQPG